MLELNNENFDEFIKNSEKLVFVDFMAPWCGPCKMLGPILEELEKDHSEHIVIGKVNIDDNKDLSDRYQISSIPTIQVYKNGELVETITGFLPKIELDKVVARNL